MIGMGYFYFAAASYWSVTLALMALCTMILGRIKPEILEDCCDVSCAVQLSHGVVWY